jgi:hypothetical protein
MKFSLIFLILLANIYAGDIQKTDTTGILFDKKSGLFWQDQKANSDKNKRVNYKGADRYCKELKLGGYMWRLPTIDELKSIVDYKREDIAIKMGFTYISTTDWYWAKSEYVSDKSSAWVVYFFNGFDRIDLKGFDGFVRCVRQ